MAEEMTVQQAAQVWAQVPAVETALTARFAGLSNILTGLAFLVSPLPFLLLVHTASLGFSPLLLGLGLMFGLLLTFFLLRTALWRLHGTARPGSMLGMAYDKGQRPGYKIWYLLGLLWIMAIGVWHNVATVPPMVQATLSYGLFVAIYTMTMGHWESKREWSRRPYLLVIGSIASVAALAVDLFAPDPAFYDLMVLGAGWLLAGLLLYFQA